MPTEEGTHTLADGQKLYTKTWKVRRWKVQCEALLTSAADRRRACKSSLGLHPRFLRCKSPTPYLND